MRHPAAGWFTERTRGPCPVATVPCDAPVPWPAPSAPLVEIRELRAPNCTSCGQPYLLTEDGPECPSCDPKETT